MTSSHSVRSQKLPSNNTFKLVLETSVKPAEVYLVTADGGNGLFRPNLIVIVMNYLKGTPSIGRYYK